MKKKKLLATGIMSLMMISNIVPAFAADVTYTKDDTGATIPITCEVSSGYTVSLPALVNLEKVSGIAGVSHSKDFKVGVKGNIASNQSVIVEPTATSFTMKDSSNVRSVTLNVEQADNEWSATELDMGSASVEKDATASTDITLAGSYSGNMEYKFYLKGASTPAASAHVAKLSQIDMVSTMSGDYVSVSFDDFSLTDEQYTKLVDEGSVNLTLHEKISDSNVIATLLYDMDYDEGTLNVTIVNENDDYNTYSADVSNLF